tara:strand:+ start:64 stop:390 length:327 start_codon:yes stop_codon:yes gene_type:complete
MGKPDLIDRLNEAVKLNKKAYKKAMRDFRKANLWRLTGKGKLPKSYTSECPPMTTPPTPADTLRRMIAEADGATLDATMKQDMTAASFYYAKATGLREALKVLEKNDG